MEGVLRIGGYQPWQTYKEVFPNMPDAIDFDAELGWVNKPGLFIYPDFSGTGVITLTNSTNGTRSTGPKNKTFSKTIVATGDSFVQGQAISDEETFAWKLQQEMTGTNVVNLGVPGYGTYQSLLTIDKYTRSNTPDLIIYGFNDFHEMRNTASFIWLRGITLNSTQSDMVILPYGTIENGELVRHSPDKFANWPGRKQSALITAAEDVYEGSRTFKRTSQGADVTRQIIIEMDKTAKQNGSEFIIVFLASENAQKKQDYLSFFSREQLNFVDCTHPKYDTPEMKVPVEGHPNGKLNTYWADCIMIYLDQEGEW
jgi:hypothetical protein